MVASSGAEIAVCVAGMHRSGTSMIARILAECGVYLGEPQELLPATEANPEGHFEHAEIVALNDAILGTLGGAWDLPPARVSSLLRRHRLAPLRQRAAELVDRMRTHAPWGWKDPRTSLTLPFWRPLVPELRVIVCVRDVVAVAHSLAQRGHSSELFSMRLWLAYNRRLLNAAPPERTLVVRYESFFDDPRRQVELLVARLALVTEREAIARAAATVNRKLRHHDVSYDTTGLPRDVARCQRELLARAIT
jgi:hypothetical protein